MTRTVPSRARCVRDRSDVVGLGQAMRRWLVRAERLELGEVENGDAKLRSPLLDSSGLVQTRTTRVDVGKVDQRDDRLQLVDLAVLLELKERWDVIRRREHERARGVVDAVLDRIRAERVVEGYVDERIGVAGERDDL